MVCYKLFHHRFLAILAVICAVGGIAPQALAEKIIFDMDIIQNRGFDPHLATQFQDGARFPEGESQVSLVLNGRQRGKVDANFDAQGELCVTESLLRQARLRVPFIFSPDNQCVTVTSLWPQGVVTAQPDSNTLTLVLPESAISDRSDYEDWEHGGLGGVLNYNAQYLVSQAPTNHFNFWQIPTEAGFNAGDWIVRSNQIWSRSDNDATRFRHQSAWAERTLYGIKSRLRTGRFTLTGNTLGVGRILGLQLTPETALYKNVGAAAVMGVADSSSVIEIRQSGVLLYSTTVPPGPFILNDFSLLNTHTELQLTQVGSDGNRHQYTIPSGAYLTGASTVMPGIAFGLGRWDQEGYDQHPLVSTLSRGWQILPHFGLQTDFLYSPHYRALGITADLQLGEQSISVNSELMSAASHHGVINTLAVSRPLADNASISLNVSSQSNGFRNFSESMLKNDAGPRNRIQYGPTLNWYNDLLGSFAISWNRSKLSDGSHSDYAQLGWTRRVGKGYLSVTASRNNGGWNNRHQDTIFASWQLPLGEKTSLNTWVNHSGMDTRYGTRFTRRENADVYWNVSAERAHDDGRNSFSAGISQTTPWSQLSGNASYDSDRYRSLSLQSNGSIVLHQQGLLFSPYRTADTFAVVQAGQQKGVKIDTSAGTVRTNSKGYALVPAISSWGVSTLQIDTTSLKKNVDVTNALAEMSVARGAVSDVNFQIVSTRRVLVNVRDTAGQYLPAKLGVYDLASNFITVTSDNGTLFIADAQPDMTLVVEQESGEMCRLTLSNLPAHPSDGPGLYETIDSVCIPPLTTLEDEENDHETDLSATLAGGIDA